MEHTFHPGDLVMVDDQVATASTRGRTYRVVDRLKVNLLIEPVAGGRRVRANPRHLRRAPAAASAALAEAVPFRPPLHPGQIVTVAGAGWRQPPGQLYVVLKEKPDTRVSIARLGGDPKGRYWPSVPRSMLTTVEASQVITDPPTRT